MVGAMLPRAPLRGPRFVPLLCLTTPIVVSVACDDDPLRPQLVELHGAQASLRITLAPFQLAIVDAKGIVTLATAPASEDNRYGTPGATRDDGLDNVKVLPGWDGFVPEEQSWAHPPDAELLACDETSASFALAAPGGTVTVGVRLEGAKVSNTTTAPGDGWNKTALSFLLRPDEHFFGLGERFASVDHRGLSLYSWAEEGGLGGGEGKPRDEVTPYPNGPSMTYFPVPFFLSSARRRSGAWLPPGLWVDLAAHAVFTGGQRVAIPAPLAKLLAPASRDTRTNKRETPNPSRGSASSR